MAHSPQSTISATAYGRPWSPTSQNYTPSPRTHSAHASMSAGVHRRSTLGFQPYPQLSPTALGQYSPSYPMGQWLPQHSPQSMEVMDTYTGTGFHHLLDQPPAIGARQSRPEDMGMMQTPETIAQSSIAQRRLYRGGSYTYGEHHGTPPLQSPLATSSGSSKDYGSPGMIPRDEPYGGLIYQPIPDQTNPQVHGRSMSATNLRSAPQLQQGGASHITHSAPPFSPQSSEHSQSVSSNQGFVSPQSSHPQPLTASPTQEHLQYDPQLYQDTAQRTRQYQSDNRQSSHYVPEFAVPTRRQNLSDPPTSSISSPNRRPQLNDTFSKTSSTSVITSFTSTTKSTHSTHSATEYPFTYKPMEQHSDSGHLTPQTLADHTQVHEELHEQHVDNAKSTLSVNNGNDVEVIEYLDTLPVPPTPQD